jgi:hypothetical protein
MKKLLLLALIITNNCFAQTLVSDYTNQDVDYCIFYLTDTSINKTGKIFTQIQRNPTDFNQKRCFYQLYNLKPIRYSIFATFHSISKTFTNPESIPSNVITLDFQPKAVLTPPFNWQIIP